MNVIKDIEKKSLSKQPLTEEESLYILRSPDPILMDVVASAKRVREENFGKEVKLNFLVNIKSGLCSENCHYCSQSKDSVADIDRYELISQGEMEAQVRRGLEMGATKACLVASGWGPNDSEINDFCQSVEALKKQVPQLHVCASMGFLKESQAKKLKDSGVCTYNHNINTSPSHYKKICQTHSFDDRVDTVQTVVKSGLMSCSGVLLGMGEQDSDIVQMMSVLRSQQVHYIPINFLIPIGTEPDAISQSNPFSPTIDIPSSISESETCVTTPLVNSNARKPFRIFAGRPIWIAVAFVCGLVPAPSNFL